jgi:hypothetical protein
MDQAICLILSAGSNDQSGGNTIVFADNTGNSTPEIVIMLTGLHTLTQSDFLL